MQLLKSALFLGVNAGVLATLLGLVGCTTGRTVEGKVIDGPASILLVADEKDSRVKGPGVGLATLELRGRGAGDSERVIQEAKSKPDGSFEISFHGLTMHEEGVFVCTRPGYAPVRGKFVVPDEGRTVLIVMRRTSNAPADVPSSEHAAAPEPNR